MAWTEEARKKALETKRLKGLQNQFSKAKTLGKEIPSGPQKGKIGTFTGKKHSEETKELMREKALLSNHRRLRRKMVEYNGIMLDSTWELELAKCLDNAGISWIRPDPLKWIDEKGLVHHYFPDFYLPDYNLYLDPKNPRAFQVQKNKIENLKKQFTNLVFLCSIEDIRNFASVVKPDITRVF